MEALSCGPRQEACLPGYSPPASGPLRLLPDELVLHAVPSRLSRLVPLPPGPGQLHPSKWELSLQADRGCEGLVVLMSEPEDSCDWT